MYPTTATFVVGIDGERACYSNPAFRSERYTYPVITPPAAAGIMDNTWWRPGVRWVVERIDVLKPIQTYTQTVNEIKVCPQTLESALKYRVAKLLPSSEAVQVQGGVNIETNRTLRRTTMLYDVSYNIWMRAVCADWRLAKKAEASTCRFLLSGRSFRPRCLGMRELDAKVRLVTMLDHDGVAHTDLPRPIPLTQDLGWMVHSYVWENGVRKQVGLFHAYLNAGTLLVPPEPMRMVS